MRYLLLLYADESALPREMTPEVMAEFEVLGRELGASGSVRLWAGLHDTSTATTVRVRDGRVLVTDGPFAETTEQLGGFAVVEAASIEGAGRIAERIPTARFAGGTVEVRPVHEYDVA